MAREPFRFVHAAEPRLDAPLVGLGNLDGEDLRRLAEDATLAAFHRVVHVCVEHDAEFLLLTGDVWHELLTLRAWKALEASCGVLADSGIRVIWAGGPSGLDDDVRRMLADLSNLTLLPEADPDSVAIVNEGRVIASIAAGEPSSALRRPASATRPPATAFQIRVLPVSCGSLGLPAALGPDAAAEAAAPLLQTDLQGGVDYLASGAGPDRLSRGLAGGLWHHPGTPQGIQPDETGPRGCSLIEVPRDGAVHVEFQATSVVRWEHLRLGVDRDMSRPQLVSRMQQRLLDLEAIPGERLLCVRWLLVGSGPLFDALSADDATMDLNVAVDSSLPECPQLIRRHVFQLRQRGGGADDSSFQEFANHLDRHGAEEIDRLCGKFTGRGAPHWWSHVVASLRRQDRREVLDTAGRLGRDWLLDLSRRGG